MFIYLPFASSGQRQWRERERGEWHAALEPICSCTCLHWSPRATGLMVLCLGNTGPWTFCKFNKWKWSQQSFLYMDASLRQLYHLSFEGLKGPIPADIGRVSPGHVASISQGKHRDKKITHALMDMYRVSNEPNPNQLWEEAGVSQREQANSTQEDTRQTWIRAENLLPVRQTC